MIELAGTAAGTAYDQLHVTGPLALGGTLAVSIIDGFTPAAGNSFDILDWGSLSGTFSTIALPTLSGLAWNTSQLYTTGVLSVLAAGLAGDYNQNGVVDAADYVVWRNGLGTTYTQNDYTVWCGLGRTAGAGSVVGAAVPEPDSLALAGVLLSSVIMARRGKAGFAQPTGLHASLRWVASPCDRLRYSLRLRLHSLSARTWPSHRRATNS